MHPTIVIILLSLASPLFAIPTLGPRGDKDNLTPANAPIPKVPAPKPASDGKPNPDMTGFDPVNGIRRQGRMDTTDPSHKLGYFGQAPHYQTEYKGEGPRFDALHKQIQEQGNEYNQKTGAGEFKDRYGGRAKQLEEERKVRELHNQREIQTGRLTPEKAKENNDKLKKEAEQAKAATPQQKLAHEAAAAARGRNEKNPQTEAKWRTGAPTPDEEKKKADEERRKKAAEDYAKHQKNYEKALAEGSRANNQKKDPWFEDMMKRQREAAEKRKAEREAAEKAKGATGGQGNAVAPAAKDAGQANKPASGAQPAANKPPGKKARRSLIPIERAIRRRALM